MRRRSAVLLLLAVLAPALAGCDWLAAFSPDRGLTLAVATTWDSGISFAVRIGPTAPVQHEGDDATAPLGGARIEIRDASGALVTSVVSDDRGLAQVALRPGTYVAAPQRAGDAIFPTPPAPVEITVPRGRFVALALEYDSGIR